MSLSLMTKKGTSPTPPPRVESPGYSTILKSGRDSRPAGKGARDAAKPRGR